jgi:23S rRNA pseudouridine2604 synthase
MCEYFGYEVVKLERVRIMNINIKGLPLGEWRLLTEDEMTEITSAIEKSSSEHRPQQPAESSPKKQKRQATKAEEPETRKTGQRAPAASAAKKVIRSSVANPKARELRSNSSNSNKTGTAKYNKPSAGRAGNHRRSK